MAVREREGGGAEGEEPVLVCVCVALQRVMSRWTKKKGGREMRQRFDPDGLCGALTRLPLPAGGRKKDERK